MRYKKYLGGPGLLESVYEAALSHELTSRGFLVQNQVPVKITYKEQELKDPLIIDIVVNNKVIIEVKSTENNHPIHKQQLLTYLRLTKLKLGLLINFGSPQVKQGITRLVNHL